MSTEQFDERALQISPVQIDLNRLNVQLRPDSRADLFQHLIRRIRVDGVARRVFRHALDALVIKQGKQKAALTVENAVGRAARFQPQQDAGIEQIRRRLKRVLV